MNIWQELSANNKPFFVLAPMDDVTDTVFRQIVAKHAPADLMMTEFANADGYCSPGRDAIMSRLKYTKSEQPLIAQIWGITPQNYHDMAKDLLKMDFQGVDINMGCPIKDMIKKGACSAMMQNHPIAAEVITATKEAVEGKIPVSVKTRIGFDKIETEDWIGFLLSQKLDALTIHGRTKKEMSKVPNHWEEIDKAVQIRNQLNPSTVMIGNGDVLSRDEGVKKAKKYQLDGIMIGRGIFKNFFVFNESQTEHSPHQMLKILLEHIELYQTTWGEAKSYEPLKKFYKLYVSGFDGAAQIRNHLMNTGSTNQAIQYIESLI